MNKWWYFISGDKDRKASAQTNSAEVRDILLEQDSLSFLEVGWLEFQIYRLTPLWLLKKVVGVK
jgi:hypothetical protein